jgi:hypothetical protein
MKVTSYNTSRYRAYPMAFVRCKAILQHQLSVQLRMQRLTDSIFHIAQSSAFVRWSIARRRLCLLRAGTPYNDWKRRPVFVTVPWRRSGIRVVVSDHGNSPVIFLSSSSRLVAATLSSATIRQIKKLKKKYNFRFNKRLTNSWTADSAPLCLTRSPTLPLARCYSLTSPRSPERS